jgi:peptidyl-prolyl cis-trans isomerase SurA
MKLSILISSLFSAFFAFSQGQIVDKVIAQVGDNMVLLSDIQSQRIQAIQSGEKDTANLDCMLLEQLLYQNLLINQAKLDSVEITDAQVDGEMENRLRVIISQIGSREALEKFYGKTTNAIKEEFRPAIKNRLLAQEMERQITDGVTISPKEIETFFKNLAKDSIPYINAKLRLQQIAIFPDVTEADKEKSSKFLDDIRNQIISGEKSFKSMAALYSEDPGSRAQGGEIAATRGQMVPQFEAAVFSLKPGEISKVIESDYGFHIIKLEERKGDDYRCRHILIIPTTSEDEFSKAIAKIEECYAKLRKNEITWNDAVMQYSNDADTKWNQGNLSNPYTGDQFWDMENLNQIDPQIYILVNGIKVGEISQPSTYEEMAKHRTGVRILRLAEQTLPHAANLKDDYQLIQNAALNLKKQETIKEWVNNKIRNAYCRIDDAYKDCDYQYEWFAK